VKPAPIGEAHPDAVRAIDRWSELKTIRSQHETDWEDIARLIRPQRGNFVSGDPSRRRDRKPLSSRPIMDNNNFAAGLYGTLTNPANKWMGLRVPDDTVGDSKAVRQWLDVVTNRILASFRPAVSPFYSSTIQLYTDLTAFGNGAQYDELRAGDRRIMDITLSLAEVAFDIDGYNQVVEVVRKFRLRPEAAIDMFGPANVPAKVLEQVEKGVRDEATYYHHVRRNMDWVKGRIGPGGKRWLSIYACEIDRTLVRRAGYDEMPFLIPRWEVESGHSCGTGPGFIALASTRVNHQMTAANLRAAQRAADPTLLAPDRDAFPLNGRIAPGQVVYGGTDVRGNAMIRPIDTTSTTGLSIEMQQQVLEEIRDAFHGTLMNMAGRTGMTATEVMQIQEEKLRLMAPHLGRVQEEFLAPKIERRFGLLLRAGQLPPPPPEVQGVPLEVEYTSAAALAQKAAEGTAVMRLLADLGPLAQLDPAYIERFSPDDVVEVLHEARGAPARIMRSRDEAAELKRQRAEQQQQAQGMAMAQAGAGVARDAAQAAQASGIPPEAMMEAMEQ
jgi:hypothetical protein